MAARQPSDAAAGVVTRGVQRKADGTSIDATGGIAYDPRNDQVAKQTTRAVPTKPGELQAAMTPRGQVAIGGAPTKVATGDTVPDFTAPDGTGVGTMLGMAGAAGAAKRFVKPSAGPSPVDFSAMTSKALANAEQKGSDAMENKTATDANALKVNSAPKSFTDTEKMKRRLGLPGQQRKAPNLAIAGTY